MQQEPITSIDHPHDLSEAAHQCGKTDFLFLSERAYQILVADYSRLRHRLIPDREQQVAFELLTAFRAQRQDEAFVSLTVCRPITGLGFHQFVCQRVYPDGEPAFVTVEEIDEYYLARIDPYEILEPTPAQLQAELDEMNSYVCANCGELVTIGLHSCPGEAEL